MKDVLQGNRSLLVISKFDIKPVTIVSKSKENEEMSTHKDFCGVEGVGVGHCLLMLANPDPF